LQKNEDLKGDVSGLILLIIGLIKKYENLLKSTLFHASFHYLLQTFQRYRLIRCLTQVNLTDDFGRRLEITICPYFRPVPVCGIDIFLIAAHSQL